MTATATVVVASASGLHARPASLFAQTVARTGHAVTIRLTAGDKPAVNAASLIALLTLGAGHGAEVELDVTGEREDEVLAELRDLLATDLDAA
ncbi:HPr family phosphocarrier protein [Schumannella luteola]|uniref:Phosphocarrier protein HPr n=1 Tax=Schumannella luteola TaxID=472059 RepID=A0A852YD09_9MICO|nr:HPr family phosphocarrier protein [Schumannella luteola]NYG97507.1 phosphocarrier protein [Schumannella luteola]TPX01530.1 HPr family phosphocarrier protein [Schumannella luteola]